MRDIDIALLALLSAAKDLAVRNANYELAAALRDLGSKIEEEDKKRRLSQTAGTWNIVKSVIGANEPMVVAAIKKKAAKKRSSKR